MAWFLKNLNFIKMKYFFNKTVIFLIIFGLFLPFLFSDAIEIINPLKEDTFYGLVELIAQFIFNLAVWIAPIMFIIGGFYYLTAQGEPQKIETGKKIMTYAAIGLIIVIAAWGMVEMFKNIFGKPA